jgi:hypothetical protein
MSTRILMKVMLLVMFSFLLGMFANTGMSAELNTQLQHSPSHFASDDEEGQQDVFNTGEGFYIWTTTSTKIA